MTGRLRTVKPTARPQPDTDRAAAQDAFIGRAPDAPTVDAGPPSIPVTEARARISHTIEPALLARLDRVAASQYRSRASAINEAILRFCEAAGG